MSFGMVGRTGPGMRQVVEAGDRLTGGVNFWGEFGTRHCNKRGLCGVPVPRCVDCPSCGLGWCREGKGRSGEGREWGEK